MMPSNAETAETLEAAADLLQTVGWTQKRSQTIDRENGEVIGFCAVGAINAAALKKPNHELLYSTAIRAFADHIVGAGLQRMAPAPFVIIPWNDEPGRQAEEVIDGMLHTAKRLRNA